MIRPILKYFPMGEVNTTVDTTKLPPAKVLPYGFYFLLDAPNDGPQALAQVRDNLNNPKVDGFRLRVAWKDIQPDIIGPGTPQTPVPYNWSIIDNIRQMVFANNAATGRKQRISISIAAGILCPRWVFDVAPKVYEFSLDPSTQGAGDIAGNPPYSMPFPWDTDFQAKLRTFINAFGRRYDNDALVSYIVSTGYMQLSTMNFIENADQSIFISPADLTTVGGTMTRVDCASAQFVTRAGGGGGAGILGKVISDRNAHLRNSSTIIGLADGAPADPTDTTVYLNKTTFSDAVGVQVLVEEWITDKGDDHDVNLLASHGQNGPGHWSAYADDPAGYASSAAYIDGSEKVIDMWFTAFPNTPVLLSPPPNIFPHSNPYGQATGTKVRHYIEDHLPAGHGGTEYTNMQARRPPYLTRPPNPGFVALLQAIHPSIQTAQLYANNEPVPPFPGQPFQSQDLIQGGGYALGAIALELYEYDLTNPDVDVMVRSLRPLFLPPGYQ